MSELGPDLVHAAGLSVRRRLENAARLTLVLMVWAGFASAGTAAVSPASAFYWPPPCPTISYRSAPLLYAQRLCMNVGVRTRGTESGTDLFLTPGAMGAGLFQDNGSLVWWHPRARSSEQDHDLTLVRFRVRPYLALWSGTPRLIGAGSVVLNPGTVTLYDEHYRQAGRITAGRPFAPGSIDMHDFRITPQGDALIGIYDPVKLKVAKHRLKVVQYVVQKLSLVQDSRGIRTGRVLFQWNSLKYVPVAQSHLPNPGSGSAWDYFHGNAVAQDSDGNLLISARNTWGIYKINVKTGRVIWQIGARGDVRLRKPWCYQHDIAALGGDTYSLFDDGGVGRGCLPVFTRHPARALIFTVFPSRRGVALKLLHAYAHKPAIDSGYLGSAQQSADGDVLSDWGDVPEITEFRAGSGNPAMDLAISAPSYRGFRFAWQGRPDTRPAVAAQQRAPGTRVWASWNGSTQVVAWRVLAGLTPSDLVAVSGAIPKSGFETTIDLDHPYNEVAVQALSANGRVLRTSTPVATTLPG